MATVEDILAAARKADAAGNTADAKALVAMARAAMGQAAPLSATPAKTPQYRDEYAVMNDAPALPPHLDTPPSPATGPAPDQFGDTFNEMVAPPVAAVKAYGAGLMDQSQSPTMPMLPNWLGPRGKAMGAAIGDLGGMALSGINAVAAGTAGLVGETFGGSPSNETKLANDLMGMAESQAGISGPVIGASSKAAVRPATTAKQASARAASDLGITPSLGMTGKVGAMTAAALEKVPLAGGMIAKDAQRAVSEVEGAFNRTVATVGRAGDARFGGEILKSGAEGFRAQFLKRSEKLYGRVADFVPADTPIKAPNTVASIKSALEPFASNPEIASRLGLDKWAGMARELEKGLSWKAASDLRSQIGKSIGKLTGPLSDMDAGRLKQAYGTLTVDLEAAAKAAGPQAHKAWQKANEYYKDGAERISGALDKLITADQPERAFEAFSAMTKADRSTSAVGRVRKIKASIGAEAWGDVSASIVDRLGRAPAGRQGGSGGDFSPATFLTEWNKMAPEARRLLLPEAARVELEKLAQVAARVKTGNAERNMSNTGTVTTTTALVTGFTMAPIATSIALGSAVISAKGLTSPMFLRLINGAARGEKGSIRSLQGMAEGTGQFATDARALMAITAGDVTSSAANNNQPAQRLAR